MQFVQSGPDDPARLLQVLEDRPVLSLAEQTSRLGPECRQVGQGRSFWEPLRPSFLRPDAQATRQTLSMFAGRNEAQTAFVTTKLRIPTRAVFSLLPASSYRSRPGVGPRRLPSGRRLSVLGKRRVPSRRSTNKTPVPPGYRALNLCGVPPHTLPLGRRTTPLVYTSCPLSSTTGPDAKPTRRREAGAV